MRVAIWGSYDEGNFGDDLMALVVARACRDAGASVVGYRTPSVLTESHGIESASSLDALLADVDLCIVGGGEFLFKSQPLKRLAREYLRRFEGSCLALESAARLRDIPLAAISVGGDGTTRFRSLSRERQRLFGSPQMRYVSVRLPSDLDTMRSSSAKVEWFPDILLSTPSMIPSRRAQPTVGQPTKVGLNLHRSSGRSLARELARLRTAGLPIELHAIRSHLAGSGHDYELEASDIGEGVLDHRYSEPEDTARFLSGLDVVISSKLHVGVVALSYGAQFVSFCGKPKAKAFLKTLGIEHAYSADEAASVVDLVRHVAEHPGAGARPSEVARACLESAGHLDAVRALIARG